jgi:NADH-quinone oxidoreductase subunit E
MARINPEPRERLLPAELYTQLDAYIDHLRIEPESPRRKDTLIQVLHRAQNLFGHLPEEVQLHIANRFHIPHAEVSGVVSFYNYFTTEPKGKYQVSVCMGTACYVLGAEKVLQEFERVLGIKSGGMTEDGKFSLDSLRCVGACGLAPVAMINDRVYGKMKPDRVQEIIENHLIEEGQEA